MRAALVLVSLVLTLALPGCLGGGTSLQGPTTLGDQGRTIWQISDGLCGDGVFGSECALTQRLAVGAAPFVEIRGHGGTVLDHATLMGGTGVDITHFSTSTDDHGTLLRANVGSTTAGVGDVFVLDADGHTIDHVQMTWVAAATIVCGELRTNVTRDLTFPGLASGVTVEVVTPPMGTGGSTTLACRANDASGGALLSVDAIRWNVATGAVGTIDVHSDDLFGTTPALGATARIATTGTGHATIHAALGAATADVTVSFH
jgi:hypothetical protein